MTPLFKKLNYKEQTNIVAINSPKAFDNELEEMSAKANIIKNLTEVIEIEFVICFVTTQVEITYSTESGFFVTFGEKDAKYLHI